MPVRIADDDNGILPDVYLNRANGVVVSKWDPGFPEVRAVVEAYADASGVRDATVYHGASLANLSFVVQSSTEESRRGFLDRFMAHCVPSQRSYIHWQLNDEDDERCVQVRAQKITRPIEKSNRIYIGAQFTVPLGIIQSSALHVINLTDSGGGVESGRSYDLSFDRTYPASDPIGGNDVINEGNVTAWPLVRVVGACTNPRVENVTTGQVYDFSGLTLTAGQFINIDTFNRTIYNQAGVSQMDKLDLTNSEWWGLTPGENVIVFEPDTGTPTLTVTFRDAWL